MIIRALHYFLPLCLLLSMTACAEQVVPTRQIAIPNVEVNVGGQILTLQNDAQRCALRKPDQSVLMLDMPWPCHLSVDRKGQPRVETFDDAYIIIVQHFAPEPAPSKECRSQFQAIRQTKGHLEASIVAGGGRCWMGPVDQKNFVGLFSW